MRSPTIWAFSPLAISLHYRYTSAETARGTQCTHVDPYVNIFMVLRNRAYNDGTAMVNS